MDERAQHSTVLAPERAADRSEIMAIDLDPVGHAHGSRVQRTDRGTKATDPERPCVPDPSMPVLRTIAAGGNTTRPPARNTDQFQRTAHESPMPLICRSSMVAKS